MLKQFEQEFMDKEKPKLINKMTFEEFVEYLRKCGLELREGIDVTKAREEYNNINKPE